MRGLLRYLASTESRDDPRANQHENPRIVGGDSFLVRVYGGQELSGTATRCATSPTTSTGPASATA